MAGYLRSILVFILFVCISFFPCTELQAVPAYPYPVTVTQLDGSQLTILLKGDEFFHYKTTTDGFLLIPDNKGILTYAGLDESGTLISSGIAAKNSEQRTKEEKQLLKKLPTESSFIHLSVLNTKKESSSLKRKSSLTKSFPLQGNPKSLVILVNFADQSFVIPYPREAFTRMLNKEGYSENKGTGSARDYFRDSSTGAFDPEFVVAGPYDLPQKMEYYGANDRQGYDIRPQQMVIDACRLAFNDGIDFSEFDVDNDGVVDNVFIFYAGYNEAEGAPAYTIWPHRWDLSGYNVSFGGKRIHDYACTSELRSNKGSEMCGIGTFVHEFGHVLGLPDYYTTDNSPHPTLSEWNVMDYGSYLNEGRTPPAYSAFDRFYLGWLEPVELTETQHVILQPLNLSNQAYIFSDTDHHNLNGNNPDPTEFFTLENRQQVAWDAYLPGHGMLITRINYNRSDWVNNVVNNSVYRMGVELIRADGNAGSSTLSGDPFPGTSHITSYIPESRTGTIWDKQLSYITEKNNVIAFDFIGSGDLKIPTATEATGPEPAGLHANWKEVSGADYYYLSVWNVTEGRSAQTESFDNGIEGLIGWDIHADITTDPSESGKSAPAVLLSTGAHYITTEKYPLPAAAFSFYVKTLNSQPLNLSLEAWDGICWQSVERITIDQNTDNIQHFTFTEEDNYYEFRIIYEEGQGIVAVDDITVSFDKRIGFVKRNEKTEDTSFFVENLFGDLTYYYTVRAANKTNDKEVVTDISNKIEVRTKKSADKKRLDAYVYNGVINIYLPDDYREKDIFIYTPSGQLIHRVNGPVYNFIETSGLPVCQLYIIKAGDVYSKIISL